MMTAMCWACYSAVSREDPKSPKCALVRHCQMVRVPRCWRWQGRMRSCLGGSARSTTLGMMRQRKPERESFEMEGDVAVAHHIGCALCGGKIVSKVQRLGEACSVWHLRRTYGCKEEGTQRASCYQVSSVNQVINQKNSKVVARKFQVLCHGKCSRKIFGCTIEHFPVRSYG